MSLDCIVLEHLGSVEGASDKGAGSHRFETHFFPYLFILFKLLRGNISYHRQSIRSGAEDIDRSLENHIRRRSDPEAMRKSLPPSPPIRA